MKKRLITSALPYVNNIPHLGNIIQVLSADCYARFCRSKGYETLYICGTDEYGTASETRALQEGITPRELCDRYFVIHRDIYQWFKIDFDIFGRTSDPIQTEIVQSIFKQVDAAGYLFEQEVEQLYCESCDRFLADRFVEGICPKCGYERARGDQCDSCGALLDPTELIDPVCGVCKNPPVVKKTKHLYLDLPKALPLLETWMNEASQRGFWAKNAIQTTRSWIRDGLRPRAITRDLKWGIPVPKEGYEHKVFYVWFDAPIGYISITAKEVNEWQSWWKNPAEVELYQFIGKDNIPFHTVIFPATLLATQEEWTMLHHMSSSEYLNYEGGKFSKSGNLGVFGNDVQDIGLKVDLWRFYILYNRPEKADVNFTWHDFQEKVNGELIGNFSNLVNRTLTFAQRFFGGEVSNHQLDQTLVAEIVRYEEEIDQLLEKVELRDAFRKIFELSSLGNRAFQAGEPWKVRQSDPQKAQALIETLLYLIRDLAILLQPFLPDTAAEMLSFLGSPAVTWQDLGQFTGLHKLQESHHLFTKLDDDLITSLRERYQGDQVVPEGEEDTMEEQTVDVSAQFNAKVELKVGKIVDIQRHPDGDKLYIIRVDLGEEEERTIVSSIVPFYQEEELQDRNIVLVSNLKPANFRGVKSRGMLLAASDPAAGFHETCEVLFADQFAVGTELLIDGYQSPSEKRSQVKANHFFDFPLRTVDGVVQLEGKPIGSEGAYLQAKQYLQGEVG